MLTSVTHRRMVVVVLAAAVSLALVCVVWQRSVPSVELLKRARAALRAGRSAEAEDLARRIPSESALGPNALLIAGEAAASDNRHEDSTRYYNALALDGTPASVQMVMTAAEQLQHRGRLADARRQLRRILDHDPRQPEALRQLAFLLSITGRRREADPYLFELLRQGICNMDELILLGHGDLFVDLPPDIRSLVDAGSADPDILFWKARRALHEQRPSDAIELLQNVLKSDPGHVEAQVRLGLALWELSALKEFHAWQGALPEDAERHPETWVLRGRRAESENQPEQAAGCYQEAVRRDPNHRTACFRLSQVLSGLQRQELAGTFQDRAASLNDLEKTLLELYNSGPEYASLGGMQRAAELSEALGRPWEAWGWSQQARHRDPGLTWARDRQNRLAPLLETAKARTVVSGPLAEQLRDPVAAQLAGQRSPLPDRGGGPDHAAAGNAADDHGSRVSFVDMADAAGLRFSYFNGGDPQAGTLKMYEGNGGGIAVLDSDGDDWADLYLAQGCAWPPEPGQKDQTDRLFRNLGDGKFADVTVDSGTGDERFSQGVTAGDYDNDGFSDLYVANIGPNRLYRNNGDGTFNDVTPVSATAGDFWSMSVAMADLNGDALPDLYVVNYLTGSDVFDRVCLSDAGISGLCDPRHFAAEQDRIYLNLGDGRFEDVTAISGIVQPDGKGLGLVVADFDGSGRPSVFVANDGVPNFYFTHRTEPAGGAPQFQESAVQAGLAVNGDGLPEACMGVASGDPDENGLLDLFVTNFYHESNTLYAQRHRGFFEDATRRSGLRQPSLSVLGFGTQFIDGELDGLPDLIVSNGHVDRGTPGLPYQMPPQYFRNQGRGQFTEAQADSLGAYFRGNYLGRCLVRLDWNNDGREDAAISHLDAPTALLSNQTPDAGHFLVLRLKGRTSSRDAVGAVVRIEDSHGRRRMQQITAGDGFQASNQRHLVFGLGQASEIRRLSIRWPSGLEQEFQDLTADQAVVITEGMSRAMRFR